MPGNRTPLKIMKNNKIYLRIRDLLCEYLGFQYRFFHRKALLKLNYKIKISKKETKLSNEFYEKIFDILNQNDEIDKDSKWLNIFNDFHKNILKIIREDKSKIKSILDNPSKYNLFYGFDNNCEYVLRHPRYMDYFENDELVIDKILNFALVTQAGFQLSNKGGKKCSVLFSFQSQSFFAHRYEKILQIYIVSLYLVPVYLVW